jgi:hypothetical protein
MSGNRATIAFVKKLAESGLLKPPKQTALTGFKKFEFDNSKYNQFGKWNRLPEAKFEVIDRLPIRRLVHR